ncbi:uncharacterized protein DDB_G0271670 isoform X2 [Patella vulgata]|nr:uncharacterized protein DDB_G0271670 isoform X2 [Patella vulgata]
MASPDRVEMTPTTTTHRMHYSYADYLIDQLLAQASITDSEDESVCTNDENNMNYNNVDTCDNSNLVSRQLENARKLSVLREVNIRVSQTLSEITTSGNSVVNSSSSSDGYPQTTTDESSSENQVVPDLDLEKELVSRLHYYSDFTIDRQRKINTLTTNIINATLRERSNIAETIDLDTTECPAISERHVEGCEDNDRSPRSRNIVGSASNSSTSSTLRKSKNKSSSRNSSHPLASSTMSHSKTSSSSSRSSRSSSRSSRSNSHPLASSTVMCDPSTNIYPSSTNSESVYTWSLDENTDRVNLEESYLRSRKRNQKNHSSKRSRHSSRDRQLEQVSSLNITNMVSAIEASSVSRKENFTDSFCEDPDLGYKSQTLPRTSTRACLLFDNKSSGSSSSDIKTSSLPNITGSNRLLSELPAHISKSSQALGSPLTERLELPGKSSTTSESQESAGLEVHPASATQFLASTIYDDCTRVTEITGTDSSLLDSILTDSPKSVDSSGIFAPYNSDATESRGYTTSSVPSSDGNGPRAPPPTPPTIKAPVVADPVFKVPFSPAARSRSRSHSRSRKDLRASTPLPSSEESTQSEPLRRQLFSPLANSTQIEPKRLDKKALVKKFKKFSHSFYKKDKNGHSQIQTLANL